MKLKDACSLEKRDTNSGGIRISTKASQSITNLDIILKSRDVPLPTKLCIVKAMVLPAVVYRCESWTIKKAECQRIDAFELWCKRRVLRVPGTARSNQSILKEINPEYVLERLKVGEEEYDRG